MAMAVKTAISRSLGTLHTSRSRSRSSSSSSSSSWTWTMMRRMRMKHTDPNFEASEVPELGSSKASDILRQLNRRVPDKLVKVRIEDGFTTKYVPWHVLNRIMNLHAPEWTGEVRSITHSNDGKSVSVVYRVTIHGIDSEVYRESTGTASMEDTSFGDPVQKAEAMAFRRACARLGLGLHLYHEDLL